MVNRSPGHMVGTMLCPVARKHKVPELRSASPASSHLPARTAKNCADALTTLSYSDRIPSASS